MTTRAVGIDLGTTFSAIAIVNKHGVPEILHSSEGDRITPSVVLFEQGEVVVGNYAQQSAVVYPEQVVQFIKRHMGESDFNFSFDNQSYSPAQVSATVLAKLKHDAELRLGHRVDEAVITVPAYFGERQRQATLEAGELAGLKVLKLLNEPTAAAFAYGMSHRDQAENKKLLVFDLGGGTFDVTIVDVTETEINVLATDGADELGGKDWDDALIRHVASKFEEKHGVDPLIDLAAYNALRQKCVSAKLSLTRRPKVRIFYDFEGNVLREEVTRDLFEALTVGLMRRIESMVLDVLDDADIAPNEIDRVILAGGATRMPMVKALIDRVFGEPPTADVNPDECVALGAALEAAICSAELAGEPSTVNLRTHDVTSHSLGMVVFRKERLHNSRIIRKNSRIPADCTRENYVTSHDSQTTMDLWLVQGEHKNPLECNVLGHFEFYGITARPAGKTTLSVTFRYNANGIVEVEAMDVETGQILPHRLSTSNQTLNDLAQNRSFAEVLLLIDCSGSMYGPSMEAAKAAAKSFVEGTLSDSRSIGVVAFPGGVMTEPTQDKERIFAAINNLRAVGSTPLAEGIEVANSIFTKKGASRVLIVLADGHPDLPDRAMIASQALRTDGGRLITVGVGSHVQPEYLAALASTPSDYHHCKANIELEETFTNLATELHSMENS